MFEAWQEVSRLEEGSSQMMHVQESVAGGLIEWRGAVVG